MYATTIAFLRRMAPTQTHEGRHEFEAAISALFAASANAAAECLRDEPDPMPPGWNRPAAASSDELAETLADVLRLVEQNESPEGRIEWMIPVPDGPCTECCGTGKILELRCPDGGKCHHNCASDGPRLETLIVGGRETVRGACWRVHNAVPLSSFGRSWPDDAWATVRENTDPCPKCGGTGDQWDPQEAHLRGAEFGLRAIYRVGGCGPGSGDMRVFQKEVT